MFGIFRERRQLRRRVEELEFELEIAAITLRATKETWETALRKELRTRSELTQQFSELQSENRVLREHIRSAEHDLDLRDRLLGNNFGQLLFFLERRWEPETLLRMLYEKLSLPGRRKAAIEYYRSHGFDVNDEQDTRS